MWCYVRLRLVKISHKCHVFLFNSLSLGQRSTVCQLYAGENIFYSYETIQSHPKSLGTVLLPKYNTLYKGYECWKFWKRAKKLFMSFKVVTFFLCELLFFLYEKTHLPSFEMCSILYSVMVLKLMEIYCTTNAETSLKVEQSRGFSFIGFCIWKKGWCPVNRGVGKMVSHNASWNGSKVKWTTFLGKKLSRYSWSCDPPNYPAGLMEMWKCHMTNVYIMVWFHPKAQTCKNNSI